MTALREKDVGRFMTESDLDRVVVDSNIDLQQKPRWDAFENNHFAMRRRLVHLFLKAANKQIM